jgi:hypothetical protein
MAFLFARVKKLRHQVVLATHAPGIIRWLPPEAIKVLVVDPTTGKVVLPSQSSSFEEAFFYIGDTPTGAPFIETRRTDPNTAELDDFISVGFPHPHGWTSLYPK